MPEYKDVFLEKRQVYILQTKHRDSGGTLTGGRYVCECGENIFYVQKHLLVVDFGSPQLLAQCKFCRTVYLLDRSYCQTKPVGSSLP